jgi:hypothetical protein
LQQLFAKGEELCRNGNEAKAAELITAQVQGLWYDAEVAILALELPS